MLGYAHILGRSDGACIERHGVDIACIGCVGVVCIDCFRGERCADIDACGICRCVGAARTAVFITVFGFFRRRMLRCAARLL